MNDLCASRNDAKPFVIPIKSSPYVSSGLSILRSGRAITDTHTPSHSNTERAQKTYKAPNNTKNITNRACQVTKHDKLALFTQYCYSDSGSFGANHLHIERLIQKLSSRGTGDQRANSVLSKLTTPFGRAATALMVGGAMIATPLAANAEDNNQATAQNVSATQVALRTTPHCAPLFKNNVGRELDASFSAHDYSKKNVGAVGISIFAGQDLGEYSPEYLGTALVNSLRKRGVEAECFVHHVFPVSAYGTD